MLKKPEFVHPPEFFLVKSAKNGRDSDDNVWHIRVIRPFLLLSGNIGSHLVVQNISYFILKIYISANIRGLLHVRCTR